MPTKKPKAALGFKVHTGWAVVVATAGLVTTPEVVLRRKFELIPKESTDPTRFVYHAAAMLSFVGAKQLVKKSTALARKNAAKLIPEIIGAVEDQGYAVVASGIVGSNRPIPSDLETILAAHPLLHAAEGELFRQAIMEASEACKAPVREVPAGELYAEGAEAMGIPEERVKALLVEVGQRIGKPWSADHRESLLALKAKR